MNMLTSKLKKVQQQVSDTCRQYGRSPADVTLIAVSKTKPASDIAAVYQAGQTDFGENYLQEALDKIEQLSHLDGISWHFIGAIQSNKTRPIAENFDWVHSVDRLKIAQRLSDQRPAGMPPLNICIQVNVDDEASKSGVSLAQIPALAHEISHLQGVRLRGLMAIPLNSHDPDQQRASFRKLRLSLEQLNDSGLSLDTLSMGMSGDMEQAIAEGATMIRIGTAIFGARSPKPEQAG